MHEKGGENIMKLLHMVAFILLAVGGINWGLMGLFDYNLVASLLGSFAGLEKVVYILVGVSAVYLLVVHKGDCRMCTGK